MEYKNNNRDNFTNYIYTDIKNLHNFIYNKSIDLNNITYNENDILELFNSIIYLNYRPLFIYNSIDNIFCIGAKEAKIIDDLYSDIKMDLYPKLSLSDCGIIFEFNNNEHSSHLSIKSKLTNVVYENICTGVFNDIKINTLLRKLYFCNIMIYEINSPSFFKSNNLEYTETIQKHITDSEYNIYQEYNNYENKIDISNINIVKKEHYLQNGSKVKKENDKWTNTVNNLPF